MTFSATAPAKAGRTDITRDREVHRTRHYRWITRSRPAQPPSTPRDGRMVRNLPPGRRTDQDLRRIGTDAVHITSLRLDGVGGIRSGAGPYRGTRFPATVPGCVHTDLLATDWRFESTFDWADDGADRHDLVAAGLDTIATIEINGSVIGHTENQHRSDRFDIAKALVPGRNSIAVEFAAPVPAAIRRSDEHGPRPHANHHPYNSIPKMACNFGWDWGIDVATSGIWRDIGIESWSGVRVASVRALVGFDGSTGVLTAHIELEQAMPGTGRATEITVMVGAQQETTVVNTTAATMQVRIPEVGR